MKDLYRIPRLSAEGEPEDLREFWVCRVLQDCALIKVGSRGKLNSAKICMRKLAERIPGSYLIFSRRSHQVVKRVVSHEVA